MKTKDKELLLKDLCARLPYGVKVQIKANNCTDGIETLNFDDLNSFKENCPRDEDWYDVVTSIKPYLRPMYSMTEKEEKEFSAFFSPADCIDWLNANHFDYRGLIPMGLGIEAPEGMYDFK